MSFTQPATTPRQRISFKVAQHALYFFGDPNYGVQPDHFDRRLFQLLSAAPQAELDRLATLYPEQVAAFELGRNSWGVEALRRRVKGDLDAIPNQLEMPASGDIPAGHALHDGKVVPLSDTYVITRCQAVNGHQQSCIFPPAHPGLHRADTGRAWSA